MFPDNGAHNLRRLDAVSRRNRLHVADKPGLEEDRLVGVDILDGMCEHSLLNRADFVVCKQPTNLDRPEKKSLKIRFD